MQHMEPLDSCFKLISLPTRLWLCGCLSLILLGRRDPGGNDVLCKSIDVTYKTHQVNWPCNCHVWLVWHCLCVIWIDGSVVEFQLSSQGDHGIHCWWDLIRSKQLSSGSICHAQVFARFSGHSNSDLCIFRIWFLCLIAYQHLWVI